MELSLPLLGLLALMLGLAWFWHDSLGARERANDAANETCAEVGARLLDGTVAFRSLQAVRPGDGGGGFRLRRTYIFDYTLDGVTRRQGFVLLTGQGVDHVGL